jgi:hypothetical protein
MNEEGERGVSLVGQARGAGVVEATRESEQSDISDGTYHER